MNVIVKTRVLMVCLGNICRSPLAEGIMQDLIIRGGLQEQLEVDSAGTAGHCVGYPPDHRSVKVAEDIGISLNHFARQLRRKDFTRFDHILVMDESNLENARNVAINEIERSKVALITDFDHLPQKLRIVADPYWSDIGEFERVRDQLLRCCEGWLEVHFKKF